MADYTQDDLDRIRRAIARGERTVMFADRSTTYRSIDELLQAERAIAGSLAAATGRSKQTLVVASKGF